MDSGVTDAELQQRLNQEERRLCGLHGVRCSCLSFVCFLSLFCCLFEEEGGVEIGKLSCSSSYESLDAEGLGRLIWFLGAISALASGGPLAGFVSRTAFGGSTLTKINDCRENFKNCKEDLFMWSRSLACCQVRVGADPPENDGQGQLLDIYRQRTCP